MDEGRPASGGSVLPAGRIRVSEEVVRIAGPKPGEPHGEPRIHLVRDDGVVRLIEITCRCGEVIRIRCDYG